MQALRRHGKVALVIGIMLVAGLDRCVASQIAVESPVTLAIGFPGRVVSYWTGERQVAIAGSNFRGSWQSYSLSGPTPLPQPPSGLLVAVGAVLAMVYWWRREDE